MIESRIVVNTSLLNALFEEYHGRDVYDAANIKWDNDRLRFYLNFNDKSEELIFRLKYAEYL